MYKICSKCSRKKEISLFIHANSRICKDCNNMARRSKYKLSTCGYCKENFRPDIEGRYRFCSIICRFMDKVKKEENGCWIWRASKDKLGYGRIIYGTRTTFLAHRLSYILFRGEISEGKLILHSCNKPSCVNPNHLRIGTDADNAKDKVIAGNSNKGKITSAKLTESDVQRIKEMVRLGTKYIDVAMEFNVHEETIGHIIRGKTWKHVK